MNSNNQMIQKGKISSVEGKADRNGDKTTARVLPSTADTLPFESPVFWQHIEIPLRWAGLPPAGEKEADNCCVRRRCASFGSYSDD